MPKEAPPKVLTAEEVEQIAVTLRHYTERYEALASIMRKNNVPRISHKNFTTLKTSIKHLGRAINKAYQGYEDALMLSGVLADDIKRGAAEVTGVDIPFDVRPEVVAKVIELRKEGKRGKQKGKK